MDEKKQALEHGLGAKLASTFERSVDAMGGMGEWAIAYGMEKGMEQGLEQGLEQGTFQATLSSIEGLMRSTSWTAEQAMDALQIPPDAQSRYAELLGAKA